MFNMLKTVKSVIKYSSKNAIWIMIMNTLFLINYVFLLINKISIIICEYHSIGR